MPNSNQVSSKNKLSNKVVIQINTDKQKGRKKRNGGALNRKPRSIRSRQAPPEVVHVAPQTIYAPSVFNPTHDPFQQRMVNTISPSSVLSDTIEEKLKTLMANQKSHVSLKQVENEAMGSTGQFNVVNHSFDVSPSMHSYSSPQEQNNERSIVREQGRVSMESTERLQEPYKSLLQTFTSPLPSRPSSTLLPTIATLSSLPSSSSSSSSSQPRQQPIVVTYEYIRGNPQPQVINPKTGRYINANGPTARQLTRDGVISIKGI